MAMAPHYNLLITKITTLLTTAEMHKTFYEVISHV